MNSRNESCAAANAVCSIRLRLRQNARCSRIVTRIILNKRTAKRSAKRRVSTSVPWSKLSRTGTNLNIEDFLTFRLTRLSNALRTNMTKRYLEEFGLSLPEWRLLALVTRFSPLRFSELTNRSSMDKGQVSRTLRVMTKRGLTKMKALKRGSAYAEALAAPVIVAVTAKGKALYKAVLPTAQRRQAEILLTLSESERVALYHTLDKLFATIGGATGADDAE
jgi:DNA-binding MarR family transcriptional regulator